MKIYTFGHGTLSAGEITQMLHDHGITTLVDVRSFPGSRRHPHVNRENMAVWLPENGIQYVHLPELGGYRKKSEESRHDIVWTHPSFRNYAGHTRSEEFARGISRLLEIAGQSKTAYMCSESVWWKCHRRIISDYLVAVKGIDVLHIMHDGREVPHRPMDGLRVRDDGLIVYDQAGQMGLL